MQLEFFGEKFDRAKCNQTCDNCKAGKLPDKRDMTAEAVTIVNLFNSASNKSRKGVTMLQLSELYRGSKSKAITKNYPINEIEGFGAGSKFKKPDVERITHTMIFERILTENSVENKGGFSSDYVSLGENASSLQRGSHKFVVEFPQKAVAAKKSVTSDKQQNKEPSKRRRKSNDPKSPKAKKQYSSKKTETEAADIGGLQFAEIGVGDSEEDDDDDSMLDSSNVGAHNSESMESVLPHNHTKKLVDMLKTLVKRWADEEQMMGNNVHCKFGIRIDYVSCLQ